MTLHVKCFNDNYDVIGHVVWQQCWKIGKTLDLCISKPAAWKKLKLGTWQVLHIGNNFDFFLKLCHWFLRYNVLRKTFKNLLWNGWIDRGKTLQLWAAIHEEQSVPTDDIIGHMVFQPCYIYLKTFKTSLLQNGWIDWGETSHTCSPSLEGTKVFTNN